MLALIWGWANVDGAVLACRARTISEIPWPRNVAAGISIQYHQCQPPGLYLPTRMDTTTKAIPIIRSLLPSARLGSLHRFRRNARPMASFAGAVGNWPLRA